MERGATRAATTTQKAPDPMSNPNHNDHDPLPADLLFYEPASSPFASYARRERAEINRELGIFADDEAYDYELNRKLNGLLSGRGQ